MKKGRRQSFPNQMDYFYKIDWEKLFTPHDTFPEMVIRGTLMFMAMYALLRLFRRQAGTIGIADLLVVVMIADAGSNGMTGEGFSITDSVIVITVIVLWDWVFDWLGFKSKLVAKILEAEPLEVVRNGRILRRNLERELITEEELMSQLRLQGIDDVGKVKLACLEGSGDFSVIRFDSDEESGNKSRKKAVN